MSFNVNKCQFELTRGPRRGQICNKHTEYSMGMCVKHIIALKRTVEGRERLRNMSETIEEMRKEKARADSIKRVEAQMKYMDRYEKRLEAIIMWKIERKNDYEKIKDVLFPLIKEKHLINEIMNDVENLENEDEKKLRLVYKRRAIARINTIR